MGSSLWDLAPRILPRVESCWLDLHLGFLLGDLNRGSCYLDVVQEIFPWGSYPTLIVCEIYQWNVSRGYITRTE